MLIGAGAPTTQGGSMIFEVELNVDTTQFYNQPALLSRKLGGYLDDNEYNIILNQSIEETLKKIIENSLSGFFECHEVGDQGLRCGTVNFISRDNCRFIYSVDIQVVNEKKYRATIYPVPDPLPKGTSFADALNWTLENTLGNMEEQGYQHIKLIPKTPDPI